MRPYLKDYHVHPDYSIDACGSIDEYCQQALKVGIKEICFTPHYDADPERAQIDAYMRVKGELVRLTDDVVKEYIHEVHQARERYAPLGLVVLAGLEVDYASHIEETLRKKLPQFELDFSLGAIHCLEHIAITSTGESEEYFRRKDPRQVCEEYFGVVRDAVGSGLFRTMAHLDAYKVYGIKFYGERILSLHRGLVEPVLELMARNKVGLEINTSPLRKGLKETSPGIEILQAAGHLGVEVNAVGSDAHRIADVGRDLDLAYGLLRTFFETTKCASGEASDMPGNQPSRSAERKLPPL